MCLLIRGAGAGQRGPHGGGMVDGREGITRIQNTVFIWFHLKDKSSCQTQSQAVFLGSHYHLPAPQTTYLDKTQCQHSAPHSGEGG